MGRGDAVFFKRGDGVGLREIDFADNYGLAAHDSSSVTCGITCW
jgi:hypothetical protein